MRYARHTPIAILGAINASIIKATHFTADNLAQLQRSGLDCNLFAAASHVGMC